MIASFTAWFLDLVMRLLSAGWDIVTDLFVSLLTTVLTALSALITAIPAPTFLMQYSMGSLISMLPDYVQYFVSSLQLPAAFAILASGFAFRMGRKIFTLGQW